MVSHVPDALETFRLGLLVGFYASYVVFLETARSCLSTFQARKLCHAGTGLLLLQLDSRVAQERLFVFLFGIGGLLATWEMLPLIKPFRWARKHDVGMTVYCIVAMLWFHCQQPIYALAPMFFADPAGAVVGKWMSSQKHRGIRNPIWWQKGGATKTLGGSAAVLIFTFLSFAGPATFVQRLAVSMAAVLAEALGGDYDNLLLVIVVVGSRSLFNFMETGDPSLYVGENPYAQLRRTALPWDVASQEAFLYI
eukprot:TRINITY_DN101209_c0_g1_i1.p1 TRINITY_DN101209_c0_g1~~TRINITY_DN101209_c0_g1_i1.p1  ORF type:complete len:252 (-),score=46.96 TRINITY_DN101209_c0_g1_i1:200-955(-)